jgi:hypothetical protein
MHTRTSFQSKLRIHEHCPENHELATPNAKLRSDDRSKPATTPDQRPEKGTSGMAVQYCMRERAS